jgi:hypothetical protein
MRQRGVPNAMLGALLAWGDTEVPVGGGDVAITASQSALREMAHQGVSKDWCRKVGRLVAVVTDDGVVRTCAVIWKSGRDGRRYRRRF